MIVEDKARPYEKRSYDTYLGKSPNPFSRNPLARDLEYTRSEEPHLLYLLLRTPLEFDLCCTIVLHFCSLFQEQRQSQLLIHIRFSLRHSIYEYFCRLAFMSIY